MAIDPQSASDFKDAVVISARVAKAQKTIDAKIKEISTKAAAALKAKDGPMMQLHLKTLQIEIDAINVSLQDASVVLADIAKVEDDAAFLEEHQADIEKLTKLMSAAQSDLTKQYEAGKALKQQLEKAGEAQLGTREHLFQEISKLEEWVKEDNRHVEQALKMLQERETQIDKAIEAHDAKALEEKQKIVGQSSIDILAKSYDQRQTEFKRLQGLVAGSKFDSKTTAELEGSLNDIGGGLLSLKETGDEALRLQKALLARKITPVYVKKAAKALGLDAGAEAKLTKALSGPTPGWEKALDALVKELKLQTTGKAMVAALKKAGML